MVLLLESDTMIHGGKDYHLTLRLPRAAVERTSVRCVLGAVQAGAQCCLCGAPEAEAAFCGTCHTAPVALHALVGCGTGNRGDCWEFQFGVTPLCSSSRTHFGSDLCIVLPALPGLAGTRLVSRPFRLLSRNCKYLQKHKSRERSRHCLPSSESHIAPSPVDTCPPAALVCCPTVALQPESAQFVLPCCLGEPAYVDERSAVQAFGNNSLLSLVLAALSVVASRLSPRPVILLTFARSPCFEEFAADTQARFPARTRRAPVFQSLGSVNGQTNWIMCTAIDADEFPALYTQALAMCRSLFLHDGRVVLSCALVF
eukprot:TRINITY_DN2461_c0_g1_i6.p1 TRINITY_DN2461_c0_g1~~TRINITY_DN2461_c0_g1_i6.p1  ORF type:complete len:314 (-),score=83.38 TRINITY_DN2461_c0_g1_i6:37-978(-)